MMKCRQWTKFQTQLYVAAVREIDHPVQVKAKFLTSVNILSMLHQNLRKVLIDTPVLLLIRFCQSGFGHSLKSRPIEIRSAEVKCSLNISQPRHASELS